MAGLRPYLCLFVVCLAVPCAAAWPLVKRDDKGHRVVVVQLLLQAHGYTLEADGSFGPITESKVREFEAAKSIAVNGLVGPSTWPTLIITVRLGSRGAAVRAVQYLLVHYGFLAAGGDDGSFGPITRDAVISFQASKGLEQDGIVGPLTWEALVSGVS